LEAIAEIGYKEVEVQDGFYPTVRLILADLGLNITGYRIATPIVTGQWELWREFMKQLPGRGVDLKEQSVESAIAPPAEADAKHVVLSYLLPPERDTVDKLKRTIERMNSFGEACKAANLTFCFHNHANEFGPLEGTTAFDVLNQELDPELVKWQIDVFWATVGGRNPAELIQEYGGRIVSLHLKDMAPDTPRQFEERIAPESFRPLGQGVLDIPEILGATRKSSVNHLYVELDYSPGDPIESLRESYSYLQSIL
jgi:sugar phosphate isomerase/epimerase